MNKEFFRILAKYRSMILLLTVSAIANTVLITYLLSEKFDATALVLIRPQQGLRFTPVNSAKELFSFPVTFNLPFKTTTQTYGEVIKSRAIAEKVVRSLNLDGPVVQEKWWKRLKDKLKEYAGDVWNLLKYGRIEKVSPFERAMIEVQDALTAIPTKDTYVFQVSFKGKEPNLAAKIANTASEAFVEYMREMNLSEAKGAREFIEQRVLEGEKAWREAITELRDYRRRSDVVSLKEELAERIRALGEFDSSLKTTQRNLAAKRAEIADIHRQLVEEAPFLKTSTKIADNPLVTDLRSELAKFEIDLSGLEKKLAPSHPDVLSLQAKIKDAQAKLRREVAKTVSEETSGINSIRQNLLGDLATAEARLQSLQAEEKKLLDITTRERGALRA